MPSLWVRLNSNSIYSSYANAVQLDSGSEYVDWAIAKGYGVIDANVPQHLSGLGVSLLFSPWIHPTDSSQESFDVQTHAQQLCCYIWDNYIGLSDAKKVIIIGIGKAAGGVTSLMGARGRCSERHLNLLLLKISSRVPEYCCRIAPFLRWCRLASSGAPSARRWSCWMVLGGMYLVLHGIARCPGYLTYSQYEHAELSGLLQSRPQCMAAEKAAKKIRGSATSNEPLYCRYASGGVRQGNGVAWGED